MFDTIVAISSGNVNQPISIIRLSGSDSFDIVTKIFTGKVGKHKTITYGYIVDGEEKIDEVLITWFKNPNSFTGEQVVEINAHGGVINSNRILGLILANGARIAENGEFSRRAFLNGKIDLVKAEAIHDLIFAKTNEQAKFSIKKFDGNTSKLIKKLKSKLLYLIATCETNIDYPEYDDIEQLTTKTLLPKLEEVLKNIDEILVASNLSQYIYQGINVAIVGKSNAGKSSLFNMFLNEEKAIVTSIPGTTRDIIEGQVQVGQFLLNLKDTAGINPTKDEIEKIGIEKTLKEIKKADLVIHVVDPTQKQNNQDVQIVKECKNKNYIKVLSKSDLLKIENSLSISSKNKDIQNLINKIKNTYGKIDINNSKIINNTRQLSLIKESQVAIKDAIKALKEEITPDTVIIDIQKAWDALANILGQANRTDLLTEMFANFCLGK